ncbi:LysR family transcriptional regulator [Deinococcus sp.]|uniref:LysR family transcriptional regulator n=1 Tax=Deinococcus sp. TaxID=47478 RepID=UPI003B597499
MQLDMNLLTALDILLEEQSVGGAAFRLNLSEPAMSRTLGRIRRVTGDAILVRTGRSMTPTPYALAVQEEVHTLVERARALLKPEGLLDLATLERTFTLRCHDTITAALGAGLLSAVMAQAPGVRLRFLAEASTDTQELRHGQIDLEIGAAAPSLPELCAETLGSSKLVVAMRTGHPGAGKALTLSQYAAARHLTVSRRGRLSDPIDDALAAHNLTRTVVATAPTSTAALRCIGHSDVMVVIPQHLCQPLVSALGLCTLPLPLELRPVPIIQVWHQRSQNDQAHRWLRAQVRAVMQTVSASE